MENQYFNSLNLPWLQQHLLYWVYMASVGEGVFCLLLVFTSLVC